jgi:hypothetical protein
MIRQRGNHYQRTLVVLDGQEFHDCVFEHCRLVFRGEQATVLEGCTFNHVAWALDGPAATTLAFLAALYQGAGPGGRELVERTLASIRDGSIVQRPGIPE